MLCLWAGYLTSVTLFAHAENGQQLTTLYLGFLNSEFLSLQVSTDQLWGMLMPSPRTCCLC